MVSHYRRKRTHAENDTTDAETRRLRGQCHRYFDPGWRDKSRWPTREAAYIWLQQVMGLSEEMAHMSKFDKQQCLKLLEILNVKPR